MLPVGPWSVGTEGTRARTEVLGGDVVEEWREEGCDVGVERSVVGVERLG